MKTNEAIADDYLYHQKKERADKAKAEAEKLAADKAEAEKAEAERKKEFDEKYPQGETHPDKVEPKKKPKEKPAPKTPAERLKARNAKTLAEATKAGIKHVFKCHVCGLVIISQAGMVSHLVEIEGWGVDEAERMVLGSMDTEDSPKEEPLEEIEEAEEVEEAEEGSGSLLGLLVLCGGGLVGMLAGTEKGKEVIAYLNKAFTDLLSKTTEIPKATGTFGTNPKPPGF